MALVLSGRRVDGAGEDVAVKLLRPYSPYFDQYGKERIVREFTREAELLSGSSDPRIARFHDLAAIRIGQEPLLAIVREKFTDPLLKNPQAPLVLPVEQTMGIAEDMAAAMEYVHRTHGRIVTDLSPRNIMQKGDGYILSDLNLTVADGAAPEILGMSTTNIPPEFSRSSLRQTEGKGVATLRTSVYQLAMLVNLLLGGRALLPEEEVFDGRRINYATELPPGFKIVLERATAERPSGRQETPGQLVAELTASLKGI